jgi:hypothetical protein
MVACWPAFAQLMQSGCMSTTDMLTQRLPSKAPFGYMLNLPTRCCAGLSSPLLLFAIATARFCLPDSISGFSIFLGEGLVEQLPTVRCTPKGQHTVVSGKGVLLAGSF